MKPYACGIAIGSRRKIKIYDNQTMSGTQRINGHNPVVVHMGSAKRPYELPMRWLFVLNGTVFCALDLMKTSLKSQVIFGGRNLYFPDGSKNEALSILRLTMVNQ